MSILNVLDSYKLPKSIAVFVIMYWNEKNSYIFGAAPSLLI